VKGAEGSDSWFRRAGVPTGVPAGVPVSAGGAAGVAGAGDVDDTAALNEEFCGCVFTNLQIEAS
jgi:hypothetical protein